MFTFLDFFINRVTRGSFLFSKLSLIPLVLIIISIIREFTVVKAAVLVLLILVSIYSGAVSRKNSCMKCKMRLICPGCAVKE